MPLSISCHASLMARVLALVAVLVLVGVLALVAALVVVLGSGVSCGSGGGQVFLIFSLAKIFPVFRDETFFGFFP